MNTAYLQLNCCITTAVQPFLNRQAGKSLHAGEYQCQQCSVTLPGLINLPFSHFHLIKNNYLYSWGLSLSVFFKFPTITCYRMLTGTQDLCHLSPSQYGLFLNLSTPLWSLPPLSSPLAVLKIPQDIRCGCGSKMSGSRLVCYSRPASPGWKPTIWPFNSMLQADGENYSFMSTPVPLIFPHQLRPFWYNTYCRYWKSAAAWNLFFIPKIGIKMRMMNERWMRAQ